MSLEIFNAFGDVKSDLDPADVEKLDDGLRAKLFAVVEANTAKRDAEAALQAARADVRQRENEYHAALTNLQKFQPPQSFQEALQASIAASNGRAAKPSSVDVRVLAKKVSDLERKAKDKPELATELPAARKELAIARLPAILEAANNTLATAQANVVACSRNLREAERDNSEAIASWIAAQTDRPTHLDLVREAAKRDAERLLAKKAAEPPQTGPMVFPLEQHLKAKGQERSKRTYFGPR